MPSEIKKSNSKYLNEYKDNYYLDMVKYNIIKNPEGSINNVANVMFSSQKTLGYFLVVLFYYCFEFDLFKIFEKEIILIQNTLKETIFDEFSAVAISLIAIFFAIKTVKDQRAEVWIAILQILIVLVVANYFMLKPVEALHGVDRLTKEISKNVLVGTYKATGQGDPESATIAATNTIWQVFVHNPWQILEFGDNSFSKKHEDEILRLSPESEKRKSLVKDLSSDKYFTVTSGMKRVGFMILYSIPLMVKAFLVMALCLIKIGYDFFTIFFIMGGPFVFILALVPFFGIRVVQNWFMKILSFQGVNIVVTFILAVISVLDTVLFSLTKDYGWLIVLTFQLVIALIIFLKPDVFIDLFTGIKTAASNPASVNRQMRKDVNIEKNLKKGYLKNAAKASSEAYNNTLKGASNVKNKVKAGVVKTKEGAKNIKDKVGPKASNMTKNYEAKNKEKQNFRKSMVEAEGILDQQYEDQKQTAEDKAEKLDKDVEYPDFVRKVQTREKLGVSRFEERDVISVANQLNKIKEMGGSSSDLIKEDPKNKEQIKRPKNIDTNEYAKNSDKNESTPLRKNTKDYSKEYVDDFNKKYNKNYKPVFMEKLIKNHGRENVKGTLDTMDRVSKKSDIKNPAGYLVTTLKNNDIEKEKSNNIDSGQNSINDSKESINIKSTNMINEKHDFQNEENQEKIMQKLDSLEKTSKKDNEELQELKESKTNQNISKGESVKEVVTQGMKMPTMDLSHELTENENRHQEVNQKLDKIQKDVKNNDEEEEFNNQNKASEHRTNSNEVVRPINLEAIKNYLSQEEIKGPNNLELKSNVKMRSKGSKE